MGEGKVTAVRPAWRLLELTLWGEYVEALCPLHSGFSGASDATDHLQPRHLYRPGPGDTQRQRVQHSDQR